MNGLDVLTLVGSGVVLMFGFVLLFGAPYVPTLKKQTGLALDALELSPGQTLLELGSGDGAVLKAAARHGIRVVGFELNPLLILVSYVRTWRYRKQVRLVWGNFWTKDWPEADAIFVFVLAKHMKKLDKKIIQTYPNKKIKLASHGFAVPGKKPIYHQDGVYVYQY